MNKTPSLSAGAEPADEGVRERGAVDGDEEEQEALEEERRQGEEPQQLRVRTRENMLLLNTHANVWPH